MSPRRLAPLLLALAGSPSCTPPPVAQACFVDAHCADGLPCIDGGCGDPGTGTEAAGSDDAPADKLDVGTGIGDASTCETAGFVATNAGCEFWAVDLPNLWEPGEAYGLDVAADQTFAVVVANVSEDENAVVDVYAGDETDPLQHAVVAPLSAFAFLLPDGLGVDPTQNDEGRAFRIESDRPITAYQFQPLDNLVPVYSNDATALLPSHVLQTDYIAVTSTGNGTSMFASGWTPQVFPTGAFVTVVATQDDTRVELHPTDVLRPGDWQDVRLDRGETFSILSDPLHASAGNGSLAGTRILSDRPIAAFAGNVGASVPSTTSECCIDHVEHQLLPTVAWGTRYVLAPPPDPHDASQDDPASVHLVGAHDDTPLRWVAGRPPGAPDVIHAHQDVELSVTQALAVQSDDPNKPFSVAQILWNSAAANPGGTEGDPAMIVMPSIEQLVDRYVLLAPHGYRTSIVTIVAPEGTDVQLDGDEVGGARAIGESGWTYRRASIDEGAHVIEADQPVGITVVGYDRQVSYAYAGGSAVEPIHDAPPAP